MHTYLGEETQSSTPPYLPCILIFLFLLAKETKLIEGERNIVKNTLITTLPYTSKEYLIRFDVMATDFNTSGYNNIIHFTTKNVTDVSPGGRIPAAWFYCDENNATITVESTVNNESSGYATSYTHRTGKWISIEIGQTKHLSEYRYNVKVNGNLLRSNLNTYPQDFPNVKVYASDNCQS